MTTTGTETLQWEPGSLPTGTLARVLIDALADVWAGSSRPEEFREQLEHACECATGIPLAGLPSAASNDAQLDAATQRFHTTYRAAYSAGVRSTEPEQAHDEAVQEAIEAALEPSRRRSLHEGAHHHGGKYSENEVF